MDLRSSVTGFGEIMPLWQFFAGLSSIWQNFEPTGQILYAIVQIFIVVSVQILKQ